MRKSSLILLSLVLAGACNYKAVVDALDFPAEAPAVAAKNPVDSVYLLGMEENLPDSSSLLGNMTVYSPLIWMEAYDSNHSPFVLMLRQARKAAREMGGNAIQVFDCSARTLSRVRMIAKVYSIKQPPLPANVSPDSCRVHIKSLYGRSRSKPVALYFNDSLTGIAYGSDWLKQRSPDFGAAVLLRMEEHTIEWDKGGILSMPESGVTRFTHKVMLEKGSEYYFFIYYLSARNWTDHYFVKVTKDEFELNQYWR
jgi:hypothetical protein